MPELPDYLSSANTLNDWLRTTNNLISYIDAIVVDANSTIDNLTINGVAIFNELSGTLGVSVIARSDIEAGQVVRVYPDYDENDEIVRMYANDLDTSYKNTLRLLWVAREPIDEDQAGVVYRRTIVTGLDTSEFDDVGSDVYIIAEGYITADSSGNNRRVGTVIVKDASNGEIFFDLTDVLPVPSTKFTTPLVIGEADSYGMTIISSENGNQNFAPLNLIGSQSWPRFEAGNNLNTSGSFSVEVRIFKSNGTIQTISGNSGVEFALGTDDSETERGVTMRNIATWLVGELELVETNQDGVWENYSAPIYQLRQDVWFLVQFRQNTSEGYTGPFALRIELSTTGDLNVASDYGGTVGGNPAYISNRVPSVRFSTISVESPTGTTQDVRIVLRDGGGRPCSTVVLPVYFTDDANGQGISGTVPAAGCTYADCANVIGDIGTNGSAMMSLLGSLSIITANNSGGGSNYTDRLAVALSDGILVSDSLNVSN